MCYIGLGIPAFLPNLELSFLVTQLISYLAIPEFLILFQMAWSVKPINAFISFLLFNSFLRLVD